MLTLILGRGKSGKTTRLMREVLDCPAQGMAQRILVVPEQLSHETERALSAVGGDSISFVSEVLSFTRMASRVCSLYGGGARTVLDQGGRMLTARLALSGIQSQLHVFASSAGRADFLGGIVDMIDELKSYGVGADQLRQASRQTEGLFAQKLKELGLILGAYDAVMAQGSCDPRDRLTLLREQLLDTDYAEGRYFFVDGFTDFTAQELGILEALLDRSGHMTVTLPWDVSEAAFAPGRETAQRLQRMARKLGREVRVVHTEYRRTLPPELELLERRLLSYSAAPYEGICRAVEVYPAEDRLGECRHCAALLRRRAMEGCRWRDMAVAAGDTALYGPLLEAVCRDYGVPLYTGQKTPVTAHPAAAFLLCALEAVTEGMDTETVTAYLRTSYSGIPADGCDRLENYAYTWSIRGKGWLQPWTEHPDGYDGTFTDDTRAELEELNRLREQALSPLDRLSQGIREAENTRASAAAIYRFLEDTDCFRQIGDQVERLTAEGRQAEAQETAQVWNTLMECLQQMVSVLGETAQSGGELLRLLRMALEQYELGTIPATLDAVRFGGTGSLRGQAPRVLVVLGTNEGSIPAGAGGGSLLTEWERDLLRDQMHIELAPNSEGNLQRQLLEIYGAFTSPREKLVVCYAQGAAGEELRPSFLVERLRRLFPHMETEGPQTDAATPETLGELYLTAEQAGNAPLAASIRAAARLSPPLEQVIVSAKSAALPREQRVSPETAKRLFGEPVALTASRLDALGNCPLSFFLNYGLKARPRREASFDAAEFGTFMHYILEQTVGELKDRPLPLSSQESGALVEKYMEPYLETRMQDAGSLSPRQKYLYTRNGQEAELLLTELSRELSVSEFRPCALELRFGQNTPQGTLTVSGSLGTGRLDGVVDRADLWRGPEGDYLRVIDYKSGTKKFDYTDLYGGVGMQMLLYLFALERTGIRGVSEHPIPAGVLYFPARRAIAPVDAPPEGEMPSAVRRSGLVLADQRVIQAMEADGGETYLPVQKRKGGLGDYAVSARQLRVLEDFVEKRMSQAVDRIFAGEFAPEPFYRGQSHDPCQWCDYGDVCQKDKRFRREHYRPSMSAGEFWKQIGGEEDG